MNKRMKIVLGVFAAFICVVGVLKAVENTTNSTLTATITATKDTSVVQDQNVYATSSDRRGLIVAHYDFAVKGGAVGNIELGQTIPKGAILSEDALIEVQTAVQPADSTNTITLGGITVLATGTTLNSTGIKQAVATPGITTSAGKVTLAVAVNAATSGVFTVYIPYILGNAE